MSPRIGVYFAVSPCIVVYRIVSVCICSIDLNRRGRRQLALRKKSGKSTRIRVGRKNQVLTRIVGYQERPVLTVLTSIVHVSSGRRVPSRIGTCRGCIEKVKSGVLRIGHVFMVFTRVSNGPNPACAESACIVMYRACPNWGAGIHRYRKVSPVSCIEYVSRGPRFTHFFKTCEIREIHARYQGKKMEEYRIIIPVKKRAIHYDTWYWGKTDPIFGGNPPAIRP